MTGLTVTPGKTLKELFTMNHQRSIACKDFNEIWRNHNLDVMLSPPAPHTALPFDQWKVITYTSLLNFYDVPGCIIPIGKVDQELDVKDDLSLYGEADKEVYKLCMYNINCSLCSTRKSMLTSIFRFRARSLQKRTNNNTTDRTDPRR